eukprot:gene1389-2674_t
MRMCLRSALSISIMIFLFSKNFVSSFQPKKLNYALRKFEGNTNRGSFQQILKNTASTGSLRSTAMKRHLDFFGLGIGEILVICVGGVILYGPSKLKKKTNDSADIKSIPSDVVDVERYERIIDMKTYAKKARNERALVRINKAIEAEDPRVLNKLSDIE